MKILFIEDNETNKKIMKKALQAIFSHIDYLEADNGIDALALYHQHVDIDFVILNNQLKGEMLGPEVFIRMAFINHNISQITFGWSSDYNLQAWNEQIQKRYLQLKAVEKPTQIPEMKFYFEKPLNKRQMQQEILKAQLPHPSASC
jgi:CheY-like chemotaxis protein